MSVTTHDTAIDDMSHSKLIFTIAGGSESDLEVLQYEAVEGLSILFRLELHVAAKLPLPSVDSEIGKTGVFRVITPDGERRVHGILSRCTYTGEGHNRSYYRIEVVPDLWLLTHRYDSRIFQHRTTVEIVAEVLKRGGITGTGRFELDDDGVQTGKRGGYTPYVKREYCVQYRETDLNFISRLLEEEGIYYYFEHTATQCRMVLGDLPNYRGISALGGEGDILPFQPPSGMNVSEEHVFAFQESAEIRPNQVTLKDYNYSNPKLQLHPDSGPVKGVPLEVSDYPGNYDSEQHGQFLARVRAEELACRRSAGFGRANSPRLAPGKSFRLSRHPNRALNSDYVVTKIVHRGRQAVTRTFTGPSGGLLDPTLVTALRDLTNGQDGTIQKLAAGLLQIAHALTPPAAMDSRVLGSWVQHGGQVATDPNSIAFAHGGDPLAALGRNGLGVIAQPNKADAPVYECDFECIPLFVVFRPPRLAPKPLMRGAQTAVVVGPEDEEIHTDGTSATESDKPEAGLGRVKVLFHWDRDGRLAGDAHKTRRSDPTCWIRVSQPWAGTGYGGLAIPRMGQEVIVDFLEGDPDRPIIVGRVYNGGEQKVPQSLPKDKVRTSIRSNTYKGKGFNEITMDDSPENEHFYVKAQFNKTVEVGNNRNTSVGVDSTEIVGQNDAQVVGDNKSTDVTNAYNVTCDTMLINAKTSITLQCGASRIHMNQAGFITITGTVITSAAAINNSMVAPLTQIVGAAMLAEVGGIIQILGGVTQVRAAGQASLYGGKVDVVARGDNVIQGDKVKIN